MGRGMKRPKSFVGFVADFPSTRDEGVAAGEELTVFLHGQLAQAGFKLTEPIENGSHGWDFTGRSDDGIKVFTTVGLVDDLEGEPPRQWLMTNEAPLPFFSRVFGKSKAEVRRNAFLKDYCGAIHRAMTADGRFSEIWWHDMRTFDLHGDQPGREP